MWRNFICLGLPGFNARSDLLTFAMRVDQVNEYSSQLLAFRMVCLLLACYHSFTPKEPPPGREKSRSVIGQSRASGRPRPALSSLSRGLGFVLLTAPLDPVFAGRITR